MNASNIDSPYDCYSGTFVLVVGGLLLGVGLAIGYGVGSNFWKAELPPPAAEIRQADGSLALRRESNANPGEAAHEIPTGGVEERRVEVTVAPKDCPPVKLDLSLVRMPDGNRRVVASSPDGVVTSGLDVPVAPVVAPEQRPWAAGLSWAGGNAAGVFVERDVWRLRIGGQVSVNRYDEAEARLLVGWRF